MTKQDVDAVVTISVGSVIFKTKHSTLKAIEGTLLSKLESSSDYYDKNGDLYYFDRDPELFRHILNIHRNKEVHFPRNVCPVLFKKELQFWEIPFVLILPCCWKILYESEGNIDDLQKIIDGDSKFKAQMKATNQVMPDQDGLSPAVERQIKCEGRADSRSEEPPSQLWLFLMEPSSSKAAMVWCFIYIFIAVVSVVLYQIWLQPSVRVSRYLYTTDDSIDYFNLNETSQKYFQSQYNNKVIMAGGTDPHPALFAVDTFCLLFFVIELILTLSVCPDMKKYFTDGYNLLKIFVCVSMTLSFGLEFNKDVLKDDVRIARFMMVCKCFSVLRLLLVFRLRKIYNSLHVMLLALRHGIKELLLLVFTFLIVVVVYGCIIFSAEIETDMFPTTHISMWWALITMTTIGYGDYYPVSSFGYLVGAICAVTGIIVLALPVAAIAGTFSNLFAANSEFQKHKLAIQSQKRSEFQEQM